MPVKAIIYTSRSVDPWLNLSWEEYLVEHGGGDEAILFLWQNERTVVIGRNQNAWRECRFEELEKDGGKLARRLSGGGAVYHDRGNLNFTFIVHRSGYNLERQLDVIVQAVRSMGLNAEFSGRNDILVDGRKFSGNSYYYSGEKVLHHGTLLISTDLAHMARYLNVSPAKMSSKGIESVRARVINLSSLDDAIDIARIAGSIREQFIEAYGRPEIEAELDDGAGRLDALLQKNGSWEWRFGKSPAFDVTLNQRFEWGEVEIGLGMKKGLVCTARVFSDALEEDLIRQIEHQLQEGAFKPSEIAERVRLASSRSEHQAIIADICSWLPASLK